MAFDVWNCHGLSRDIGGRPCPQDQGTPPWSAPRSCVCQGLHVGVGLLLLLVLDRAGAASPVILRVVWCFSPADSKQQAMVTAGHTAWCLTRVRASVSVWADLVMITANGGGAPLRLSVNRQYQLGQWVKSPPRFDILWSYILYCISWFDNELIFVFKT